MYYYLRIFLKGMTMGACDAVPGVSGGTIAFITGIYEKLISSLSMITPKLIPEAIKWGFPFVWKKINGNFLLAVGLGVLAGFFSVAKLIMTLLEEYPPAIWSLFFAVVLASSFLLLKRIHYWNPLKVFLLCFGTAFGYGVSVLSHGTLDHSIFSIFLSGVLGICAMLLPGISGGFVLLILGQYVFIVNSLLSFKVDVIILFVLGCLVGLLSLSHFLKWLFRVYYQGALCLVVGLMLGSLNKLWPWKQVVSFGAGRDGELIPLVELNISPFSYQELLGLNPLIVPCFFIMVIGITAILMLDQVHRS